MKYLLDTHTFIWFAMNPEKLPKEVLDIIKDGDNDISISTLSLWEIALKHKLQKFIFNGIDIRHIPNLISQYNFSVLSPGLYDIVTSIELPLKENHRDPFDRMLIHTAIRNNMVLLSGDKMFKQYELDGLQLLW